MPTQYARDELERSAETKVRAQQAFIARGLASRDAAKRNGEYVSPEVVLRELDDMLARAAKKAHK